MKSQNYYEHIHKAWEKLRTPEKVTFFSFIVAKFMFGMTVITLFTVPGNIVWVSFTLYVLLVAFTAILAIRNQLAYHMEKDPQFTRGAKQKEGKVLLKINKIVTNEDGSKEIDFDCDEEFIAWFKQKNKLKEWDQEKFEKFVFEKINKSFKNLEQNSGAT